MQKLYMAAMFAALLFASCKKDDQPGVPTPSPVDLGLSVVWANMNLGSALPQNPGYYFAWGETQTKSSYSWENYKWCGGTGTSFNKYCTQSSYGTVDGKTQLESGDDAAAVLLGNGWRMPTSEEWQELIDGCNWTVDTVNGVEGFRVSAKEGDASIFLPFVGGYVETRLVGGERAIYWSSSLNDVKSSCGDVLYAYVQSPSIPHIVTREDRAYGLPIRPVKAK